MKFGRAGVLVPFLVLAAACGSRVKTRSAASGATSGPGVASAPAAHASGQPAASGAEDEAFLKQQLEERDREIGRLRTEVQEVREQETELRASLEKATAGANGGAARSGTAAANTTASRPDVVVAALQATLSQEQERRQVVETQLTRLKEETSAVYSGPRVPEADYLALKQELVQLQQMLADERAARERLSAEMQQLHASGAPPESAPQPAASAEVADLRVRLETLQEQRDAIEASLSRNLAASQKRIAELEQQLSAANTTATPPEVDPTGAAAATASTAAAAADDDAQNTALRAQLDEERRRTDELLAKLKAATRVNDLIFKIQAQQEEAKQAVKPKRRPPRPLNPSAAQQPLNPSTSQPPNPSTSQP